MRASSLSLAITRLAQGSAAWGPLALWPDGIATPGMWISPRTLTSEWQDYNGTTPVATPGTVADSSNPVGLALDIRAGATVLTDPGLHMLQSTSTSRPLLSARVNSVTYTDDFSTTWTPTNTTIDDGVVVAPDGSLTATKVTETTADGSHGINRFDLGIGTLGNATRSIYLKAAGRRYLAFGENYCAYYGYYDCVTGIFRDSTGATFSAVDAGDGWWRFSAAYIVGVTYTNLSFRFNRTDTFGYGAVDSYPGDGTSGIYIWGDQIEHGTQATPYQSVPGDGSTYATDFPIFQLYDGVDDGMATATFPAGTLTSGMDCQIAVRRDSAAKGVLLTNGTGTPASYVGAFESGNFGVASNSVGASFTTWVDSVQVGTGAATTQGDLYTALPVGDWHIVEFRGLDLSAWTSAAFSSYTGVLFNGARGDILLYPSTTPTEDKDAARQWLADYYGVTLP